MVKSISVKEPSIQEICRRFGLTTEIVGIPNRDRAFRVFKGAKQVFIGTEDEVRAYLDDYERNWDRWSISTSNANGLTH